MRNRPLLSVILATHNRREVVRSTITHIRALGHPASTLEIIVVDNASTDGTREELATSAEVRLLALRKNRGSCAKALGVRFARAPILLFLDDDSYPRPGCIEPMLARFEHDPRLGAAGFSVHLPDGRQECSALPHVFVGCGVGLRAAALRAVGGLDASFFMQAEEYDLAFRLAQSGWDCRVYDDLQVEHRKTAQARSSERLTYFDARNNLRLVARYLDGEAATAYRQDWEQRYCWLARRHGFSEAFDRGLQAGIQMGRRERDRFERLLEPEFELFFCWKAIEEQMVRLWEAGVRNAIFVDMGKNIYAFHRAAARIGIQVLGIADDCFSAPGRWYRGTPLLTVDEALSLAPDALIVSNTSHVHAAQRARELVRRGAGPVHAWFLSPSGPASGPLAVTSSTSSSCGASLMPA